MPEEQLAALTDPDMTLERLQGYYSLIHEEANASKYIVSDNGKIYLINMGINIDFMEDPMARQLLFDDLGELLEETKKADESFGKLDVGFTGGMMVLDYEGDKMAMHDFYLTAVITLILILVLLFISFRSLSIPLLSFIPLLIGIIWTSGVIFLTTATTCLAFSSFLFSSHPTMRFVALVPIIGLSLCFFGAIIFLPALLRIIVDRWGAKKRERSYK